MVAKLADLRAQVTSLQEHNTEQVERRRKAEAEAIRETVRAEAAIAARNDAIREMSAYARRCGELEAQLCAQLVEHPGRKAMLLVLAELRRARLKHPAFATGPEQGFAVLQREAGELADAVIKGDIHGEHGIIREAAQVAAVAIRIVEYSQHKAATDAKIKDFADALPPCNCGWCMACTEKAEASA